MEWLLCDVYIFDVMNSFDAPGVHITLIFNTHVIVDSLDPYFVFNINNLKKLFHLHQVYQNAS